MPARRPRGALAIAAVAVVVLGALFLAPGLALARFKLDGAGGCGNLFDTLPTAQDGDVLLPMTGFTTSNSIPISRSLLIQGGWRPGTSDCITNGTDEFETSADLIAAGFVFQPTVRSEIGVGGGEGATLPVDLRNGQTLAMRQLELNFNSNPVSGPAITGTISNSSRLRLENILFESNQSGNNGVGGAVNLTVGGGSHLTIADSVFRDNRAFHGGAVEILVEGGTVLIEGNSFSGNRATGGNGGALRIVMRRGDVVLRNNSFSNNSASSGSGAAIRIERAANASGPTTVRLLGNSFSGNSAAGGGNVSLAGVTQLTPRLHLPLAAGVPVAGPYTAAITGVTIGDAGYSVAFTTSGYTPSLTGRHVHFFFDTVPPDQAGVPGAGPWVMYGGPSPYTGYNLKDRPKGATRLCVLVANADHSVIQGTGNCVSLP